MMNDEQLIINYFPTPPADLSQTLALKANFANATLTGACLEDWNIDQLTNLKNVLCSHVYFQKNR